MHVKIVPYASLEDFMGSDSFAYEVPSDATVATLLASLANQYPTSAELLDVTRVANNDEYLSTDDLIQPNLEYSLIPPVSGG